MTSRTPSGPARRTRAFRSTTGFWWAAAFVTGLVAVLLGAGAATAEPPSLASKKAQAERVLAEVREIDSSLAKAAEAYNAATIELDRIKVEQRQNARLLGLARSNLGRAQTTLAHRLVAMYTSDEDSTVEVLLGATSLEDFLDRLETVDRVSSQDALVLEQVERFRTTVRKQKVLLAKARERQAGIVEERAAQKAEVERKLAERQALLATIRDEIERLKAVERRRQLAVARQARARIAATPEVFAADLTAVSGVEVPDGASLAPPAARFGGVVGIAMQYLGIPYLWGGSSPSTGFDCSGFVMFVYAQVGISLPHNAAAQYGYGTPVSRDQLEPGDLVFFDGLGHNGIYVGGGQFIHSPHTGDVVKISSLYDSWYNGRWVGGRRL